MMMSLRETLRHCVLNGFAAVDVMRNRESLLASSKIVQVVNFHHMYPYEETAFGEFLDWFASRYKVISYSEAVERVRSGNIDAAYGAITFDDGLKSVLSAGRILQDRGYSATFFVCSGVLGETCPTKRRAFYEGALMDYESDEFLSWEDVELLQSQGHEIGNHTVSHPKISQLADRQAQQEIDLARESLSRRLGDINHFAWPFGSFELLGQSVIEHLWSAGYTSIASGVRGAHAPHTEVTQDLPVVCMRRDNVEARWPLGHIKHFLINNAQQPVGHQQWWPQDWRIESHYSNSN